MNISRSEIYALRDERNAYAKCVNQIREACALPDVPLAELPAAVEQLLSELADRQIRRDIEEEEFVHGDVSGEALPPLSSLPRMAKGIVLNMDPEDDEWAPEDTVVPVPVSDCRNCLRLVEIDGRLTCSEPRSLPWHYATIAWPGPGCVWGKAGDAVYGGRR